MVVTTWGEGLCCYWVEIGEATKHSTMHRMALHYAELSNPKYQQSQGCKTLVYTRYFGKT